MISNTSEPWHVELVHALDRGDAREAFLIFRGAHAYPTGPTTLAEWKLSFDLFARVSRALSVNPGIVRDIERLAETPDDLVRLELLSQELIEQNLPDMAATVLAWADDVEPAQESVVIALGHALEAAFLPHEGVTHLRRHGTLISECPVVRYQLALLHLLAGQLDATEHHVPALARAHDPSVQLAATQLGDSVRRARAIRHVTALDDSDLIGWHFVLNGSFLLHRSREGSQTMNGRYAFVQDDWELCREAIHRVDAALDAMELAPPRIFALPERGSQILAHAAGQLLDLPVLDWPEDAAGRELPGLIVAYDMSELSEPTYRTLQMHRPGQVLWNHANCWTSRQPLAADLVTYLHQQQRAPWGERLSVDPKSGTMSSTPPLAHDVKTLAAMIVKAPLPEGALGDIPRLQELISNARLVEGSAAPGALRDRGSRRGERLGSPVTSNRFV